MVSIDKIARLLSFPACCHGGGRGHDSTVLCGDHRCDAAGIGTSSPGDVVLMVLVSLRQISFGEIVDVAAFDLIDGRVE